MNITIAKWILQGGLLSSLWVGYSTFRGDFSLIPGTFASSFLFMVAALSFYYMKNEFASTGRIITIGVVDRVRILVVLLVTLAAFVFHILNTIAVIRRWLEHA